MDGIKLTIRYLKSVYDGSKSPFQDFAFNFSTYVVSCGWDKSICLVNETLLHEELPGITI